MNHRLYSQAKIAELYKQGDITFHEAVEKAKRIEHPGDRAGTFYILEKLKMNKINPTPLMDRVQYAEIWTGLMIQRAVGIAGHLTLLKGNVMVGIYKLLLFVSFVFFIRFFMVRWETRGARSAIDLASTSTSSTICSSSMKASSSTCS